MPTCAFISAVAGSLSLLIPAAELTAHSGARALAASALAQTTPAASGPHWATVTGDGVMLRSGPSVASAYPFARLHSGQPLRVLESQYGWARVAAVGPAFDEVFGFVKADSSTTFDPATRSLLIAGKTPLLAPNMDANFSPDKSWRQLTMLDAGERLPVVAEVKGERDNFYSVRLPSRAEGWVNLQFLTPVSQEEADRFNEALQSGGPFPGGTRAPAQPARTPEATTPAPTPGPAPAPAPAPEVIQVIEVTEVVDEGAVIEVEEVEVVVAIEGAEEITRDETTDPAADAAMERERRRLEARVREISYQDLEAIWAVVRTQPTETAELEALRQRYIGLAIAEETSHPVRELARARAEQIELRIEVQRTLRDLADRRAQLDTSVRGISNSELALLRGKPFDAVGRLMASTVYDGERLPLLYRVVDPTNNYTLAYVLPSTSSVPSEALGLMVGIKGKRQYDETLRIDVLSPQAIEVLDVRATAVVDPHQ